MVTRALRVAQTLCAGMLARAERWLAPATPEAAGCDCGADTGAVGVPPTGAAGVGPPLTTGGLSCGPPFGGQSAGVSAVVWPACEAAGVEFADAAETPLFEFADAAETPVFEFADAVETPVFEFADWLAMALALWALAWAFCAFAAWAACAPVFELACAPVFELACAPVVLLACAGHTATAEFEFEFAFALVFDGAAGLFDCAETPVFELAAGAPALSSPCGSGPPSPWSSPSPSCESDP